MTRAEAIRRMQDISMEIRRIKKICKDDDLLRLNQINELRNEYVEVCDILIEDEG